MGIVSRFVVTAGTCVATTLVAAAAIVAVCVSPAIAQKRLALVVGINDYPHLKTASDPEKMQLAKAVADATTMSEVLKGLGFDVQLARNANRTQFLTALESVKRKIQPGDTFVFFYAGHGVSMKGSNLFLPSDMTPIDPDAEQLIRGLAIAETDIIESARQKGAGLIVLALDACRDNPIEEYAREQARVQGRAFRSLGSMRSIGLDARPTSGVFSIYSAGIGQQALDRLSRNDAEPNSVFTRIFAKRLLEHRDLASIMEDVKEEVATLAATVLNPDTNLPHAQYPAYYNETRGGRIFLAGRPTAVTSVSPVKPETPRIDICAGADSHWKSSEAIGTKQAFEDHLSHFPSCAFAGLARVRIASLVTAPPPPPNPCAAAADHWRSAEAVGSVNAFDDHVRKFPSCAFATLARERIASLQKLALPRPTENVGGPIAITARAFDGHWHSPEWQYSYTLRDGVGTATTTNSPNFKPGDVIIRIRATGPNTFAGEQVYRDGRWYKITGTLRTDGKIFINGEKNVSWAMQRTQ